MNTILQMNRVADETQSLHVCRDCGCIWRLWKDDGGWSLADEHQKPEKCCDNSPDFLSKLRPTPGLTFMHKGPCDGWKSGWLRAIDETLVVNHLGVANADDDFETAMKKLGELIQWEIKIATDPAVNGGFKLVPIGDSGKREPLTEWQITTLAQTIHGALAAHALNRESLYEDQPLVIAGILRKLLNADRAGEPDISESIQQSEADIKSGNAKITDRAEAVSRYAPQPAAEQAGTPVDPLTDAIREEDARFLASRNGLFHAAIKRAKDIHDSPGVGCDTMALCDLLAILCRRLSDRLNQDHNDFMFQISRLEAKIAEKPIVVVDGPGKVDPDQLPAGGKGGSSGV